MIDDFEIDALSERLGAEYGELLVRLREQYGSWEAVGDHLRWYVKENPYP